MILNIKKDKIEITHDSILMSQIKTSIYNQPLQFIINVSTPLSPFEIEDEVTITLVTKQKVKAYYHSSFHPTLQGQRSTALIFTNQEHVKIKYNLYPNETPVFGYKLMNAPRGTNLNDRLEWEMRKKGVCFTIKDWELKVIPIDNAFSQTPLIIDDMESMQILDNIKNRHNYMSIEPNKEPQYSINGIDYPIFIPLLQKHELKALDKIIHPSIAIVTTNPNHNIDIGSTVTYQGLIYTIISKVISSLEDGYKVTFRLGQI